MLKQLKLLFNRVHQAYIKFLDNKKVSAVLEKLKGNEYIDTFWKYFNAYSSISEGFDEFENKFVLEKAEEWCKSLNPLYRHIQVRRLSEPENQLLNTNIHRFRPKQSEASFHQVIVSSKIPRYNCYINIIC